jgi:hypothetical protein
VYNVLVAARGKPVLFFPARFDAHEVQAADGCAYNVAMQRFNGDHGHAICPSISTLPKAKKCDRVSPVNKRTTSSNSIFKTQHPKPSHA